MTTIPATETSAISMAEANVATIRDVSEIALLNTKINFVGANPNILGHGMEKIGQCSYKVISDNQIELILSICGLQVRESSKRLSTKEEQYNSTQNMVTRTFSDYKNFTSAYKIEWANPIISFGDMKKNSVKIDSYDYSYRIDQQITTKAFIKKSGEFIIDPAYTYGIPMFSGQKSDMRFDINGTKVVADTISVKASGAESLYDFKGEDYIYADITFSNLNCKYNTSAGYSNTAQILDIHVITEDTYKAITDIFTIEDASKSPKMTETYNTLVKNLDEFNKENTHGITLLDLDFDEKPELLVSNLTKGESEWGGDWKVDVNVYRISDGKLKYIDTIYNKHRVIDYVSNNLGLKSLSDGSQAWFSTSYKNRKTGVEEECDYLYTLNGDSLNYTEVARETALGKDEEGDDIFDYYIEGEKIVCITSEDFGPYNEENWTYYNWKDYTAAFGPWEIFGWARGDYCKDIEKVFDLYSDWMFDGDNFNKYDLSKREMSYNIAYMVDAFYLGDYNNDDKKFYYEFLGAYAKPVIYLYPEQETKVSVSVDFADGGEITCSYPEYNGGWTVTAKPDGTIFDENGDEYYCLYWEGLGQSKLDMSKGFCVKGKDTAKFLREKLLEIGLTAREANEFIIYWLPIMQENPYNVITLHTEDYAKSVPLTVSPKPDTEIRVFMTFYGADGFVEIKPQKFSKLPRAGFTVVEWGGGEINPHK